MTTTTKNLVVLGAGTAGTMVVNKLRKRLPDSEWTITVVAKDDIHDYQPGYLFIPFGINTPKQVRRSARQFLPEGVAVVTAEVQRVDADAAVVHLVGGRELPYDQLVIATGTTPRPDQTPGTEGEEFHKSVGEFYTFDGAVALRDQLALFKGGRLVVHITELPSSAPSRRWSSPSSPTTTSASAACATRSRSSSSPRSTAPSPSRSRARPSGTCSTRRASPSRPTS